MRRQVGYCFTLIELLVVVAIIALLASLLLPSLARARMQGLASACTSNLRQIGMALHQYGGDNNDMVHPGYSNQTWHTGYNRWYSYDGGLIPYLYGASYANVWGDWKLRRGSIIICPQASAKATVPSIDLTNNYGVNLAWGHYLPYNPATLPANHKRIGTTARFEEVSHPEDRIYLPDTKGNNANFYYYHPYLRNSIAFIHVGKSNALCVGGNVRGFIAAEIFPVSGEFHTTPWWVNKL